jgi:hypothetical protein
MELVVWGLLIGMVGMVWLLVAASIQDQENESRNGNNKDKEHHPAMGQDQPPPVHPQTRRMNAAA